MLEEAVLIGLSAWRLSILVAREAGPFDCFLRLRDAFGAIHDEDGSIIGWGDSFLARLVICPWCLSVWLAAAFYGVWQVAPTVVLVCAAMAVAVIIEALRPDGGGK